MNNLITCGALVLLLCVGCKKDDSEKKVAMETVTTKTDVVLPGHPHKIDYYIPSNATSAVIFLHGVGDKKEGFAYNMEIKSDGSPGNFNLTTSGEKWLISQKTVAIFPQGQASIASSTTWSNYAMNSGVDDVQFLEELVSATKSDTSLGPISKVYILGYSNGGMMANRVWCESPNTFDAYATLAGPPSSHLNPIGGSHPCSPTTIKPYIALVGDHDKVLQSTGNMSAPLWTINPASVIDPTAWLDAAPQFLNDKVFHNTRVSLKCGGSVAAPVTSQNITSYSDCSSSIQLKIFEQTSGSGGDHCLRTIGGACTATLQGNTGVDPKTAAIEFLKNF